MKLIKKIIIALLFLIIILVGIFYYKFKTINIPKEVKVTSEENLPFKLAPGFSISVFAKGVTNARVMTFDPKGTMLVSQPSEGKISALVDTDWNGKVDDIITVVDKLNNPHGLAFYCGEPTKACTFYVADTDALLSFDYDATNKKATNQKKLLDLPSGAGLGHFTRTLLFLPYPNENKLLISIGSSCNVCHESNAQRASIISYDITTGKSEPFAIGLRNSVFMDLHPITGKVYATEMGRDGLGDDIPPDEINIIMKEKNYGWPNCYGKNIHDTNFDKNTYIRNPCMEPFETESLVDLQAHSAPLGLAFIQEEGWPEEYWFSILVAYHGSWNRSVPTGYKVVLLKMNKDGTYSDAEDFITGWLKSDGTKVGRPVDIKVFPGGTIYISDDGAGMIYRVTKK